MAWSASATGKRYGVQTGAVLLRYQGSRDRLAPFVAGPAHAAQETPSPEKIEHLAGSFPWNPPPSQRHLLALLLLF